MVCRVNQSRSTNTVRIIIFLLAIISISSFGQLFKKNKSKSPNDDRSSYAYQTFSTTQPKKKKKGYAGDEAKFNFEKPRKNLDIYKSAGVFSTEYFGHRRPPTKRSPGHMKLCKVCGIRH